MASQDRNTNLLPYLLVTEEVGKDLRQGSSVTGNNLAQISENVRLLAVAIDVSLAGEEQILPGRFPLLYADREGAD